jgi:endonuclease/exonuclease/phosphatase (EEP) superfamily protein YafD
MITVLHIFVALVAIWLISGTLLNLSKHPHWYIRLWDFGRTYVAAMATVTLIPYAIYFRRGWFDWLMITGLVFVIVRQLYMIFPYTPIAPKKVKPSDKPPGDEAFRLIISNVLQENTQYDLWLKVVRESDPDVIVAVEIDEKWDAALRPLERDYPHVIRQVQENYYGMVMYSRLRIVRSEVRFLVQEDVPSIHATLRLKNDQHVCIHALHPRPPEPMNDQDSTPRDAELVLMGKEIDKHQREDPTIVCGDLNDVAWSFTTQLFLRLSKLLDPRMGRGMYNSFKADSRIWRFPLDHVFHSDEFKLIDLRVCDNVGSDHFPMLIELSCQPEAARDAQPEPNEKAGDREEAKEIVEEQAEREQDGEEHGHVSGGGGAGNARAGAGGQGSGRG